MENSLSTNFTAHVVAVPYPHRSHINCMINLCKSIASRKPDEILVTLIVTQEWLGCIGSDPKPDNIRFASIPNNVIPLENQKAADVCGFFEAAMRNMEAPVEKLLVRLQPPVTAIIGDVELRWPTAVANRRNIPVALLWTMSADFYNMLNRLNILVGNQDLTLDLTDKQTGNMHIAGISSEQVADLQMFLHENDVRFLRLLLECLSQVPQTNYLLLNTVQELEAEEIDSLKARYPFPIYSIGPSVPYWLELEENHSTIDDNQSLEYLNWLDSQPAGSVLYIAFGSFLAVSNAQMDEIAEALNSSGIRYFWVALDEASRLRERCSEKGLVVPWCNQLKVLNHSSIGGFWSHCGWNSTLESLFSGIPMLTSPLFLDQFPNQKRMVEEWKNGWKMMTRSDKGSDGFIKKVEIVRRFMDHKSKEGKEMREKAREFKVILHQAIIKGGSSEANLDAFVRYINSRRETSDG